MASIIHRACLLIFQVHQRLTQHRQGSGTRTSDINKLLGQFQQMQKLMKMSAKGKIPRNMMNLFGG